MKLSMLITPSQTWGTMYCLSFWYPVDSAVLRAIWLCAPYYFSAFTFTFTFTDTNEIVHISMVLHNTLIHVYEYIIFVTISINIAISLNIFHFFVAETSKVNTKKHKSVHFCYAYVADTPSLLCLIALPPFIMRSTKKPSS